MYPFNDSRAEMEVAQLVCLVQADVLASQDRVTAATNPVSRFLGRRALGRHERELEQLIQHQETIHAQRLSLAKDLGGQE